MLFSVDECDKHSTSIAVKFRVTPAEQSSPLEVQIPAQDWEEMCAVYSADLISEKRQGKMIHALRFTALSVSVVLIPLGVLSAVMSQFEPTELMTPAGQIERNLHTAGNGLVTGAVWVCFFALPVLLGLISLLQLFKSKESAPQTREVVDTDLCTKAEVKQ